MLINKFIARGTSIISESVLDTDAFDAEYLQYALELLQQARETSGTILVSDAQPDDVRLGLGMPPIEVMRENILEGHKKDFLQIADEVGDIEFQSRECSFYLSYNGSHRYHVVSADPTPFQIDNTECNCPECTRLDNVLNIAKDCLPVINHVFSANPSLLMKTAWSEEWDRFVEYVAAAMLLKMEADPSYDNS